MKLRIVDEMNTSERTGTFEQRREKSIPSDLEGIKSLPENTKKNEIGPFERKERNLFGKLKFYVKIDSK